MNFCFLRRTLPLAAATQQYTCLLIPCAHRKLNVRQHRTTPKPETHIAVEEEAALTRFKFKGAAASDKIEHHNVCKPHSDYHHHHHHHGLHDSKQHKWLGGTCTRMLSARCWCCCSVLLLLWRRKHALAKWGTGYQKGGASGKAGRSDRKKKDISVQGGTYIPGIFWPRGWLILGSSNIPHAP